MGAQYGKPHTMKLRPFAAACGTAFICLSVSPSVLAEESTQLEEVVVTADRKARTVDETLTPVTVITRKDIEKYQATDVAEVDQYLGNFTGRIARDNWVDQADYLAKGDVAGFSKKYGELGSEIKK